MEKEIKYKIYLQNENTGEIFSVVFDYAQIFSGLAKMQCAAYWEPCKVIGKAEFTGRIDCVGKEIFDKDFIEFNKREWGGNDNIHQVSWDNKNSEWCWGGGSASDMEWRTVIGNPYENPELCQKSDLTEI